MDCNFRSLYRNIIDNLPGLFPQQFACLPKYLLLACLSGFLRGQEIVHLQYLISTEYCYPLYKLGGNIWSCLILNIHYVVHLIFFSPECQLQVFKLNYYYYFQREWKLQKSKMALFSIEVIFIPFLESLTAYSKYLVNLVIWGWNIVPASLASACKQTRY